MLLFIVFSERGKHMGIMANKMFKVFLGKRDQVLSLQEENERLHDFRKIQG